MKSIKVKKIKAFSIIELLVAMTAFLLIAIPIRSLVALGYRNITYDNSYLKAVFYAKEGIEAARYVRAASWSSFTSGTHGIQLNNNGWQLTENPITENGYERSIIISDVYRDANGNIVDGNSGTLDPDSKKVVSKVNWTWLSVQTKEVSFETYLTHEN